MHVAYAQGPEMADKPIADDGLRSQRSESDGRASFDWTTGPRCRPRSRAVVVSGPDGNCTCISPLEFRRGRFIGEKPSSVSSDSLILTAISLALPLGYRGMVECEYRGQDSNLHIWGYQLKLTLSLSLALPFRASQARDSNPGDRPPSGRVEEPPACHLIIVSQGCTSKMRSSRQVEPDNERGECNDDQQVFHRRPCCAMAQRRRSPKSCARAAGW